ncbi:MAG: adenylate/guanylate cyclase domain-containing protein [Nitrospirota bacterium]
MKTRRLFILSIIGIVSALLTIFLYAKNFDSFYAIDLKLRDVRFKTRGDIKPDSRIVVVAIDAKSINELGRWPWDRKIIAHLIETLKSYGVKTIALDIVFSEPSNSESDKALSEVIRKSGNVVSGYFFRHEEESKSDTVTELLQHSRIKVVRVQENVTEVPVLTYPNLETNLALISKASVSSGFFNIIPDRDGIIRVSNMLMLYEGDIYPSLALSALRHYLGSEIILDIAYYGVDGLIIGDRKIPVDESGRFTLNYYGKQGTFRTISAVDVIRGKSNKDALKNTLVFIGATEIGIYDMRATPLDPVLPGVEIHATVASNILQNQFLIRDGRVQMLEVAFIMIFPVLLSVLLCLVRRTIYALILFLAVINVYFYFDYIPFAYYFFNTNVIYPFISIGITYVVSEAYRNLIEERHGRFLKKAFSSYVSPELVGEIIKNPNLLKLGGEKREITVLFLDIRDFTAISEKLVPESLVMLLNQFLGPMTDIILKHKGTLDKYIGDAIMALYNAPLKVEEHPLMACKSALVMRERLKDINKDFSKKGLPEIDIGIGINTGDVIVGNMGTDIRFDYTAIGDTVNLASRLEGMNKIYKTHIIVSEFTVRKLSERRTMNSELKFRELDLIRVKGKEKPVKIYEMSTSLDEVLIKKFEGALGLYRRQQFKEAEEKFKCLSAEYGDKPSDVFAERCTEFINNPPEKEWNGVYIAKIK